ERAGVLALHPRRVLAVFADPGVVDDPSRDADPWRDPLGAGAHQKLRLPRRVGQKLLQGLVAGPRLIEPKQGRLQTLPAAMLDQSTHIQQRVLALPHMRQWPHYLIHERKQPLPRLARRHLDHRCFHPSPPRTMTSDADTVRRQDSGPFSGLTTHY